MSKLNTRVYKLDRAKIMKRCAELNTTISDESRKIGFQSGYIGQCISRGANKMQVIMLCNILDCNEEDILLNENQEEQNVSENENADNKDLSSKIDETNKLLEKIASSLEKMTILYERAWIDKE